VCAVGSVPAIFAILGLRAPGFAPALVLIGSKTILVGITGKIPAAVSLSVTFGLIAGGVLVPLWTTRTRPQAPQPPR